MTEFKMRLNKEKIKLSVQNLPLKQKISPTNSEGEVSPIDSEGKFPRPTGLADSAALPKYTYFTDLPIFDILE